MELRHLRYFLAVADWAHFGRAARALHLSQPALSRQIADLERELDVRLFDRTPRGAQLTAAGDAFVPYARAALASVANGATQAREAAHGVGGPLEVGLPDGSLALSAILAELSGFRERTPGVRVTVSGLPWALQPRAVLAGTLDIGFAWSAGISANSGCPRVVGHATDTLHLPGLCGRRLVDDPTALILLSADHPLASDTALDTGALGAHPFVFIDRALHPPLHDAVVDALHAIGLPVNRTHAGLTGVTACVPLLTATRGWSVATARACAELPMGLVARPLPGLRIPGGLDVIVRATDARPAVQAFIAALLASDALAELPPSD